ncbi:MAG: hypothetical protein F6K44_11485 [Moorea sp. SIO3E2]|nr:hypothetical protein [Moorena sp. SIO3E2]
MLVSAYLVERGLILEPDQVDSKTNVRQSQTASLLHNWLSRVWCSPLMRLALKKNGSVDQKGVKITT